MAKRGPKFKKCLCIDCGEEDETKFSSYFEGKTGLKRTRRNRCTKCHNRFYENKPERKEYKKNNKFYKAGWYLERKYGLTQKQYNEMLYSQILECAACGKSWELDESVDKKAWPVDHCHRTGKVRGIICDPCNRTLGCVDDSIEKLEFLIKYLKERG